MAEVDMSKGTIKDVVELIDILNQLRLQVHSGELTEAKAKLELGILKTILQAAGLNLQYLRMMKWLEGAMPIGQRSRQLDKAEKPPEKPNGSTEKEKTN